MERSPRVALITGAGRGIGRATAIEFFGRGFDVAILSRTRRELTDTARHCGNCHAIVGDVSDPRTCDVAVRSTFQRFGRLDVLVHAAGVAPRRGIEEMTLAEWRATLDTNLSAAFFLAKATWPIFKTHGGGSIVNVSSFSARDPFPGLGAYGAAKAGVNMLGGALAREGAPHRIRVHTVAPAATETPLFRTLFSHEQYPTEKTLEPREVARIIAQCADGDLRHTSGEVIYLSKSEGV